MFCVFEKLLGLLEEGLEHLIPGFEDITGHCLRGRGIQVIVRSYEQVINKGDTPYRISPWHREGFEYEKIAAAGVMYTEVTLFKSTDPELSNAASNNSISRFLAYTAHIKGTS